MNGVKPDLIVVIATSLAGRESFLAQSPQKQIHPNRVSGQTDKFVGLLIARDPFSAEIRFLNSLNGGGGDIERCGAVADRVV